MASKKFSDLAPMHQGLILALAPVVVAIVIFYELVSPLQGQATQLKQQVMTLHRQNMRGQLLETQRAQLKQRIAQAQAELAALQEIVPDQPADDRFIKMIYGTAAASSVAIRSIEAVPVERATYYTKMPFKMHLDGTYYAMVNFFSHLASSPRIVNVSDLTLGSPTSSGGGSYKLGPQETVAANCVLTTFFNSPPPPAPTVKRGALGRK
ncbi:MAG: type 4a pilus biogenesis protein PilO [Terriglobia bacterium]